MNKILLFLFWVFHGFAAVSHIQMRRLSYFQYVYEYCTKMLQILYTVNENFDKGSIFFDEMNNIIIVNVC